MTSTPVLGDSGLDGAVTTDFSLPGGRTSLPNNGIPVVLEVSGPSDAIAAGVLSVRTSDVVPFSMSSRGALVVRTRDGLVPVVRHLVR